MFLCLSEIESVPVEVQRHLELIDFRGSAGERLVPGRILLSGQAVRGSLGVEFRARFEGTVSQQCSRCLEPFERPVGEDFFLILTPQAVEYGSPEQEMQAEDADLYHVGGDRADLREITAEQVLLALPLKPVCREGCAGLCPTCGANRNRIECRCHGDEVDPRLAPLVELKKRMGGG